MKFHTKNYHDDHATAVVSEYPDGSIKLTIKDKRGQILCVPTVCLRDFGEWPTDGHVFIADYGSTEGALQALQDVGVLGRTDRILDMAVNTRDPLQRRAVHECKLLTAQVE